MGFMNNEKASPEVVNALLNDAMVKINEALYAQDPHYDRTVCDEMARTALDNLIRFASKHSDYGRGNIQSCGEVGLLHRIQDKVSRLVTLHFKGREGRKPNHESIEDSINDLAIHALMLQVVRQGGWPGVDLRWSL